MKKYYVVYDDGEYNHYSKDYDTYEEAAALMQTLKEAFDEFNYIYIESHNE